MTPKTLKKLREALAALDAEKGTSSAEKLAEGHSSADAHNDPMQAKPSTRRDHGTNLANLLQRRGDS